MNITTLQQVATWAGGTVAVGQPQTPVGRDVVIDSRLVTPGSLFVAIKGERVDGHDFLDAAARAGATAALVDHVVDAALPQVVVHDTVEGLSQLARGVAAQAAASGLVTVGVTGSSGKTSTKDLIAQVLEPAGPTVAPVGSFNNEIGAPLTACKVDASTRFLVAEMGARGLGHIAWLCSITPPTIAVVLNVGHAHLGEFGSQDVIAQAKGELVEAVGPQGWAVLNADDPRVLNMSTRTSARLAVWSSTGDVARTPSGQPVALRVWASDIAPDELQRYAFTLNAAGTVIGSARVRLAVMGEHGVANALAAAAVGLAAGLGLDAIAAALTQAKPRSKWRMQLDERSDGLAVLNDAYNANPDSMRAALESLARLRRPQGRLIAILGDMLELGQDAAAEHRALGERAAALGVDELLGVGEFGPAFLEGFAGPGRAGGYFSDKDELTRHVLGRVSSRDVVLVKASRGMELETVADALLQEGARQ